MSLEQTHKEAYIYARNIRCANAKSGASIRSPHVDTCEHARIIRRRRRRCRCLRCRRRVMMFIRMLGLLQHACVGIFVHIILLCVGHQHLCARHTHRARKPLFHTQFPEHRTHTPHKSHVVVCLLVSLLYVRYVHVENDGCRRCWSHATGLSCAMHVRKRLRVQYSAREVCVVSALNQVKMCIMLISARAACSDERFCTLALSLARMLAVDALQQQMRVCFSYIFQYVQRAIELKSNCARERFDGRTLSQHTKHGTRFADVECRFRTGATQIPRFVQ